jgi:hypothetical protein
VAAAAGSTSAVDVAVLAAWGGPGVLTRAHSDFIPRAITQAGSVCGRDGLRWHCGCNGRVCGFCWPQDVWRLRLRLSLGCTERCRQAQGQQQRPALDCPPEAAGAWVNVCGRGHG